MLTVHLSGGEKMLNTAMLAGKSINARVIGVSILTSLKESDTLTLFSNSIHDQITNLFKYGIARPRPCHEADVMVAMRLVKSWCGGAYGYFSGHASNSMAVAIFSGFMLKYRFKYLIYFLIIWAIAMGYSRIYIGVHYPLDVLSGMIFGGLSGYMFYRFEGYLHKRFTLR